jgi:hypothetical protein
MHAPKNERPDSQFHPALLFSAFLLTCSWSAIFSFQIRVRAIYFLIMDSIKPEAEFAGNAIINGLGTKRVEFYVFLRFSKLKTKTAIFSVG